MRVGLVYRGYDIDLVTRPSSNSGVSSTTRLDAVPILTPDQQPDDRVRDSKTITAPQVIRNKADFLDLGQWRYNQPLVTNFAQEVLAVEKLKYGRQVEDVTEAGIRASKDYDGWQVPIFTNDDGIYQDQERFQAGSRIYDQDTFKYNDTLRAETDRVRMEEEGGDEDLFRRTPRFFQENVGKNSSHLDFDEKNLILAESGWDWKDRREVHLQIEPTGFDRNQPEAGLDLARDRAGLALEYMRVEQAMLAQDKLKQGLERAVFEPAGLTLELDSSPGVEAFRERQDDPATPGLGEPGMGREFFLTGGSAREPANREDLNPTGPPEIMVGSADNTIVPLKVAPAQAPLVSESVRAQSLEIDPDALGPVLPPFNAPDLMQRITSEAAEVGFQVNRIRFDREPLISFNEVIPPVPGVVVPNRKVVTDHRHSLVVEERPVSPSGRGGKTVFEYESPAYPLGIESRDNFLTPMNPTLMSMTDLDITARSIPPFLLTTKENIFGYDRIPMSVDQLNRQWGFDGGFEGVDNGLLADDLERKHFFPEFPPEVIVAQVRSDNPFDHRSHYKAVLTAANVPQAPVDYIDQGKILQEVHNVAKEPESERRQAITENQLYGRDHPQLTKIVRLKEVEEMDKFERVTDYLEGRHTPPVDKGRKDTMPNSLESLTIGTMIWGWDKQDD